MIFFFVSVFILFRSQGDAIGWLQISLPCVTSLLFINSLLLSFRHVNILIYSTVKIIAKRSIRIFLILPSVSRLKILITA